MSQYSAYQYSIHCLSNGSEYTDTTLLLTVERGTTFCQRYAITGLTSLAARLAADQKVPLHTIRACFVDGNNGSKGVASLLLSLNQAGVGEVTICGGGSNCGQGNLDKQVETMANIILGPRRRYPLIRTCEVPRDGQWYKVYEDDYLRVYGKIIGDLREQEKDVVWVYTLLKSEAMVSFGVVPGKPDGAVLQPLPEDVSPILECIIFPQQQSAHPRTHPQSLAKKAFATRTAKAGSSADSDDGLLIRATRQAKRLAAVLPFSFFFRSSSDGGSLPNELPSYSKIRFLLDGATAIDDELRTDRLARSDLYAEKTASAVDEKVMEELRVVWSGECSTSIKDENEIDLDDEEEQDENEIDLGDDDDEEQEDEEEQVVFPSVPHLLVLGTGCATPSALRGSSGYALLTPSFSTDDSKPSLALTAILDCGEGTLTNLHRHLPSSLGPLEQQLAHIRFIWISHGHLDHYGGLEDLIVEIHQVRSCNNGRRDQDISNNNNKRQRTSMDDNTTTPVVIAPAKVLQFLDASLTGRSKQKERWYRGVTHRDLETSPFAQDLRNHVSDSVSGIHLLRSIQVEHCAYAHALVLNLTNGFRLCYSGDTRPSTNLIRATAGDGISLLLHEATFDDDERGKKEAIQKKHSTVLEALGVAKRMGAKASLLTHFSQRYPKSPPGWDSNENAAFAVDGMWFPLTDAAVEKLPSLSRLVQQTLSD